MGGRMLGCDFFFQAEDGIRDYKVTGVQTCALPIFRIAGPDLTRRAADRHPWGILRPEHRVPERDELACGLGINRDRTGGNRPCLFDKLVAEGFGATVRTRVWEGAMAESDPRRLGGDPRRRPTVCELPLARRRPLDDAVHRAERTTSGAEAYQEVPQRSLCGRENPRVGRVTCDSSWDGRGSSWVVRTHRSVSIPSSSIVSLHSGSGGIRLYRSRCARCRHSAAL